MVTINLRPGTVHGYNAGHFMGFYSVFFKSSITGGAPTIYGESNEWRFEKAYCYVLITRMLLIYSVIKLIRCLRDIHL